MRFPPPENERKLYDAFEKKLEEIFEDAFAGEEITDHKAPERDQRLIALWDSYLKQFSDDVRLLSKREASDLDAQFVSGQVEEFEWVVIGNPMYTDPVSKYVAMSDNFATRVLTFGLP